MNAGSTACQRGTAAGVRDGTRTVDARAGGKATAEKVRACWTCAMFCDVELVALGGDTVVEGAKMDAPTAAGAW